MRSRAISPLWGETRQRARPAGRSEGLIFIPGKDLDADMKKLWLNKNTAKGKLLLSVLSGLVMGLLILVVDHFKTPNPNMVLISALVFFTGFGGVFPGLVCAVMMIGYSLYFFSEEHSFVRFSPMNGQKIAVVILGVVVCYAVVALLKARRDAAEKRLKEKNERLKAEAETLRRMKEMSDSVSSLLLNIPAMTFYKDMETGKYIGCNQLFAEYAKKPSPEAVVGLTDHDIFDPETADHFVADDRRAMGMDAPYRFYENVPDAAGSPRHLQTTKMKFTRSDGKNVLLGMTVDITEVYQVREEMEKSAEAYRKALDEKLTFSSIARALSADYDYLYYVDLNTEDYVVYRTDGKTDTLNVRQVSSGFFETARKTAEQSVYEPDREMFQASFTRENVLASIADNGFYLIHYRMLRNGNPQYMSLKATKITGDEGHLVVGISNVDSDMRQQATAERMREQRAALNRITALSGEYISFYSVDPETEDFRQYNATRDFLSLGLTREGKNFFAQAQTDAEKALYPEDLAYFRAEFTKEKVLKAIEENGIYTLRFRLMLKDTPFYVCIRAALVDEEEGRRLVIGTNSIDDQVRQEEAYRFNLAEAREKANRDGLTGVKNKMAFNEALEALDARIQAGEKPVFALVVCDVNNLKLTNDTMGHLAGDSLLKDAAHLICDFFHHSPVFRVGGDEFAVIAENRDYRDLPAILDRMEKENEARLITGGAVVAAGAAKYSGEKTALELFDKADKMMYDNKTRLKARIENAPKKA